ncbi:Transmembrane component BioN of energizing module of biotin ECF transporter [Rhodovastum atsumiense]|uniref:Energy-coupling factor transporter transmembrane protein EcfT n=1 Tax=Rhodovastum atsumiense TaxID=504468 RepID=A0A5M6IL18_9PROT|nr:energy-coupling factor transporter transmembrane component T [Rhodovastum atsumiense]KAA5608963.1 energy-coupling factor transporter transmembrane protein EcfT [Rhodovastum atsumiense]CAH2603692.1 Transmembrane component BioN of energizing module of biotin ECF transporter [Rhodovastum atsumiense]
MRTAPPPLSSVLHRLPAAAKLLALAVAGTGLVLVEDWRAMLAAFAGVVLLYPVARLSPLVPLRQLRPLLWLLGVLFLAQWVMEAWQLGLLVVLRLAALVLAADLVTRTTRTEAMIATLERGLGPFARFGVNPAKVALAISLALRFIPVIAEQAREIRDAQRARGLDRNPLALLLPLIVRTLRMAGDVADAIEARSGGVEDAPVPSPSRNPESRQQESPCPQPDSPRATSFTLPSSLP